MQGWTRNKHDGEFFEIRYSRRKSLARLADKERIHSLMIVESDVALLDGIEQMPLERLWLFGVRVTSLESLQALPSLRLLEVGSCRRVSSFSPISELTRLECLALGFERPKELPHMREVEFSRLTGLRSLELSCWDMPDVGRPFDLRFLAQLTHLEQLRIVGIRAHDGRLDFLSELRNLRRLEVLPESETQLEEVRRAMPDCKVTAEYVPLGSGPDPYDRVGEVELWSPIEPDVPWSIFQDLVPELETDTNHEAEKLIRRRLREQDPALLRRLEFDSEADNVGLYAETEADLRAAAQAIDQLARERQATEG